MSHNQFESEIFQVDNSLSSMSMRDEIREIVSNYTETIQKATHEIKSLTRSKVKLEKAYEQLLTTNENILEELTRSVEQKKELEMERVEILKANQELFEESRRLTDAQREWNEEKKILEETVRSLEEKLKNQSEEKKSDLDYELEALRRANEDLKIIVSNLEAGNSSLLQEKEKLVEAHSEYKKLKGYLESSLVKCKALQEENAALKENQTGGDDHQVSDLLEKNQALTEWRKQLVEKNQTLVLENQKLKDKCAHLESVLDDEDLDIQEVLALIQRIAPSVNSQANQLISPKTIHSKSIFLK